MSRNFQKLTELDDFRKLDAPFPISIPSPESCPAETQMILRMLVRPKYGPFLIPDSLRWLEPIILNIAWLDSFHTEINASWCYVTVRHGMPASKTDDEWHFDGVSFRVELIPQRSYIWVNHTPTEYKTGSLDFPKDFDPNRHNLFRFAAKQLENATIKLCKTKQWYLISPFCLHRRPPETPNTSRTFIRISFVDIEIRDVKNTPNPLLPTPVFGRNPVESFRNNLENYAA